MYLKEHFEASPNELGVHIKVSRQMLHRVLAKMVESKMLEKLGRPTKVF
jgi:DNA-binding MarR family transcriptional regulator